MTDFPPYYVKFRFEALEGNVVPAGLHLVKRSNGVIVVDKTYGIQ